METLVLLRAWVRGYVWGDCDYGKWVLVGFPGNDEGRRRRWR